MTLAIGITGGIGSGKSTVCKIFKLLGVPVFEADSVAKSLINSNADIIKGLIRLLGKSIYDTNNKVNRKMLAKFIFNDDTLLEKVNQLIHPAVRSEFLNWQKQQNSEYIIHEAAILFESGFYKMMDFTILVSAPEDMRIKRVTKRDKVLSELVLSRISKQWSDEKKRTLASIELVNDNKNLLIPQILEIDKNVKTYGKIW